MIDVSYLTIDIECPNCRFMNPIFFRQAVLEDVIICGGCKCNTHLHDNMSEVKVALRSIRASLQAFQDSLKDINIQIRI